MLEAQVVLADGNIVIASAEENEELFWALRGGGGNFGVVTAMRCRLRDLPSVHAGVLIYPFSEAKAVLEQSAALAASMPDEFSVQVGIAAGPDGAFAVLVAPVWSGAPEDGRRHLAPFLKLPCWPARSSANPMAACSRCSMGISSTACGFTWKRAGSMHSTVTASMPSCLP
jgi:FAD/FMN-containing dehydrogenase